MVQEKGSPDKKRKKRGEKDKQSATSTPAHLSVCVYECRLGGLPALHMRREAQKEHLKDSKVR